MKIIDISMPLHPAMVVWAGQEKFRREEIKSGDSVISLLKLSSHTGTHIDAPKHFVRRGKGIDQIALEKFIGPCQVVAIEKIRKVKIRKGDRILLKTKNSQRRLLQKKKFVKDYVSLALEDAKYLAKKKVNLLGIDYLGVEAKGNPGHPVHKTLLQAGIVIVEGLDLSKVKPGKYNLVALPLKIRAGDGAPARVVLWR